LLLFYAGPPSPRRPRIGSLCVRARLFKSCRQARKDHRALAPDGSSNPTLPCARLLSPRRLKLRKPFPDVVEMVQVRNAHLLFSLQHSLVARREKWFSLGVFFLS